MRPQFLVLELHHFGDAVMAIPFLQAASRQGKVVVFCTAPVAEMLGSFLPQVETIVAARTWPGRYWQAITQLKKLRPLAVVSAWSDVRVQLIGWLCSAPVRAGLPMTENNYYAAQTFSRQLRLIIGQLIEQVAAISPIDLLTIRVERASAHDSHLQNWKLLAAALNVPLTLDAPWFDASRFALPASWQSFLTAQRQNGRELWIIHAGGRLSAKRWPLERFQKLLEGYFQEIRTGVLIIHPAGEEAPRPVTEAQAVFCSDSHSDLAAVLSAGDFVLTNDSYPAHLAAALGKKTYTIFGSGDPAIFAPWGNEARVIQAEGCPQHPGTHRSLTPCHACLEAVSVRAVEKKLAGR